MKQSRAVIIIHLWFQFWTWQLLKQIVSQEQAKFEDLIDKFEGYS